MSTLFTSIVTSVLNGKFWSGLTFFLLTIRFVPVLNRYQSDAVMGGIMRMKIRLSCYCLVVMKRTTEPKVKGIYWILWPFSGYKEIFNPANFSSVNCYLVVRFSSFSIYHFDLLRSLLEHLVYGRITLGIRIGWGHSLPEIKPLVKSAGPDQPRKCRGVSVTSPPWR